MQNCREPLLATGQLVEQGLEQGPCPTALGRFPTRRALQLLLAAVAAVLAFCMLRPHPAAVLDFSPFDSFANRAPMPFCRKSTSIVVLPGQPGAAAADGGRNREHDQLMIWSGIGKHKHIFDDAFDFDLETHQWRALHPRPGPHPISRWKAGNAQAVDGGLVVVAGDAYIPCTRHHAYTNDIWRLDYTTLRWEQATVDPGQPQMEPKRGQSTMLYRGDDGLDRIVIFAGRTDDKVLLNDVWELTLQWPNATWRLLAPVQPAGDAAPAPRRGHSAVFVPAAHRRNPQMLIYGGREDLYYYGDMWTLDLKTGAWSKVEVEGDEAPPARDHHSAAFVNDSMVIFAGHSGPDYFHAQPINDVWKFSLHSGRWEEVAQQGPVPLPRFEEAYVQYTPSGEEDSRLLVFGGQTFGVCQLNDVFELDLTRLVWKELSPPRWCTAKCRRAHERG